jgi:hypothetical protein
LTADVQIIHRVPEGQLTRIAVRWAPNGFLIEVEPVADPKPTQAYLEGPQSARINIPFTVRRVRVPLI